MKYKYDGKEILIFGKHFVNYNKNKCKIIYNNKLKELKPKIKIENLLSGKLYIKLILLDHLISMKSMFYECKSLISIRGISKWNINRVKDISFLFHECSSLNNLSDISNWDTKNVETLEDLFASCKSLKVIPDISKWNINKVKNIRGLFYECSSSESLPDISK